MNYKILIIFLTLMSTIFFGYSQDITNQDIIVKVGDQLISKPYKITNTQLKYKYKNSDIIINKKTLNVDDDLKHDNFIEGYVVTNNCYHWFTTSENSPVKIFFIESKKGVPEFVYKYTDRNEDVKNNNILSNSDIGLYDSGGVKSPDALNPLHLEQCYD